MLPKQINNLLAFLKLIILLLWKRSNSYTEIVIFDRKKVFVFLVQLVRRGNAAAFKEYIVKKKSSVISFLRNTF